jgi:hypothetical protein
MSEDLRRLCDECDQLRQRCDELQRQLNDVTSQVEGMANELGRRFSDAAVNTSQPSRPRNA